MELKFTVSANIKKPINEVFDGIYLPENLSKYFSTGGAIGKLDVLETVTWDFHDYPGRFPVKVIKCEKNSQIIFQWGSDLNFTTVEIKFLSLEENYTEVTISEYGWKENEENLKLSYMNCHGWTQMLCSLKAYLEYGINLREGFYKI